jgi:hypothetical protein
MVNLLYKVTDRPEVGINDSEFQDEETSIHLVFDTLLQNALQRINAPAPPSPIERVDACIARGERGHQRDELAKRNVDVRRAATTVRSRGAPPRQTRTPPARPQSSKSSNATRSSAMTNGAS